MTRKNCAELLSHLWADYTSHTPQAARIHHLLSERGEQIVNDHIALRSFAGFGAESGIGIAALERTFEAHGFSARDSYAFPEKHLRARYYQHEDRLLPKVFISELLVGELSTRAQNTIATLLRQVEPGFAERSDLPWAGRPWQVSHATYSELIAESEYAAWVAAFGFRPNHFTVDANSLGTFQGLGDLNAFLQANGFVLNGSGGFIKGCPAECLEQSSTMAEALDVTFADGVFPIPSCYYEFAKRYSMRNGELFQGFVPASANRLFESTDRR
jgi:Domain of unknown function (DUF1338)